MKTVKQISTIILLSVFVMAFSTANAQKSECSKSHNHAHKHGVENVIPDLTDEQKADIKKSKLAYKKEAQQIKNQMNIKRAELKALQTVDKPDLEAINKKIEEKANLRTDLEKKTAAHKQAVRSLLTDDQKVVYDAKMSHKGHKHGKGHDCGSHKKAAKCGEKKAGSSCCEKKK